MRRRVVQPVDRAVVDEGAVRVELEEVRRFQASRAIEQARGADVVDVKGEAAQQKKPRENTGARWPDMAGVGQRRGSLRSV